MARSGWIRSVFWCAVLASLAGAARADDLVVYDDALGPGFSDWSWATHDLVSSTHVHSGSASVEVELDGWEGLFFHSGSALAASDWEAVRLWLYGGSSGGQLALVHLQLGGSDLGAVSLAGFLSGGAVPGGSWALAEIPLSAFGAIAWFDGLVVQDATGGDQPTLWIDDVSLVASSTPPPPPLPVTVVVDPEGDRRPISPWIYGVNFGDSARLPVVPYPVRRWGGNSTSRYNWESDVHSTGSDWFFLSVAGDADPSSLPDGSDLDLFVEQSLAAGAQPLITLPALGWVPRDDRTKRWSFSLLKYGPQTLTECDLQPSACSPDAGNGECDPAVNTDGFCSAEGEIVGNDPTDTSKAVDASYAAVWLAHLAGRFGDAASGGVRLVAIDNEPMLWSSTHRDVHPAPATFDEVLGRGLAVAHAAKAQDPGLLVLAPVVWGWCAYFTSAADGCSPGADQASHGGTPFLEWYAAEVCADAAASGTRAVDLLDVHYYPQGGVDGLAPASSGEDPATAARRLRSVKELYDPSWSPESWIPEPVELIPRLRRWIDGSCPGLGLALTEYRWGPDDSPSGALAQAEVLAVLGREGVDLATRWVAPEPGSRTEDAFRLFLDYDGAGARVDGASVRCLSSDADAVAAYAVRGAGETLDLLLFNKDTASRITTVWTARSPAATAQLYRFDGATALGPAGTVATGETGVTLELPARSATLVVLSLDPASVFRDGLEVGSTAAWSATAP